MQLAGRIWRLLFKPDSTDFRTLFRQRTIRILTPTLLVISILALLSSASGAYGDQSQEFYIPLISGAIVLLIAGEIAILAHKIDLAGYLLLSVFLFFAINVEINQPGASIVGNMFGITVLLAALLVPFRLVIATAFICLFTAVPASAFVTKGAPNWGEVSNATLPALVFFALGYLFRLEFESKLREMERLYKLEALAREQAEVATMQALTSMEKEAIARQQAEEASRVKSEFLAHMSHELRTPLSAMIGYAGMLVQGFIKEPGEALPLSKTQIDYLNKILAQGRALKDLIGTILDLAKTGQGRMPLILGEIDPHNEHFIRETVDGLQSLASHVTLGLKFDTDVPAFVSCDSQKVTQVLKNLIMNSLKFTKEGAVTVKVGVPDQQHWSIQVADTGIGMSNDTLSHLFEEFYQADNSKTTVGNQTGTGLGLALSKRFVEMHGGTIGVASEINRGTTFTVTLPRVPAMVKESAGEPVANLAR